MEKSPITNVSIYKAIATEAYHEMERLNSLGRKPKEDGTNGFIVTYDPDHKSFKQAFITIVFSGIWLETFTHLKYVERYGKDGLKQFDQKVYEQKLEVLGITDEGFLERVKRFRDTRNDIIHEKAHLDSGEYKKAQIEAHDAYRLIKAVEGEIIFSTRGNPPRPSATPPMEGSQNS